MKKIKHILMFTNDYYLVVLLLTTLIFFTHLFFFILTYIELGSSLETLLQLTFLLIAMTMVFLALFFFNTLKINLTRHFTFYYLIYLIIINTLLSFRYNNNVNVEYFCVAYVMSLPIIFDIQKDKLKIYFILGISILSVLLINFYHPSDLIIDNINQKNKFVNHLKKYITIFSLFFIILLFIFNIQKDTFLKTIKEETKIINRSLYNKYKNINKDEVEELLEVAKVNTVLFLEKFSTFFPEFSFKIKKHKLTTNEIYLCALMKLGLDTKQMSIIANTSTKSIESRKYRIKKKFNINSTTRINDYIKSIN